MDTPAPRKIAAIGIKFSRWITSHGFALNVCPDLAHFDLIVPCGIKDYGVTSLTQLLGRSVAVEDVTPHVVTAFREVFGYELIRKSQSVGTTVTSAADKEAVGSEPPCLRRPCSRLSSGPRGPR